MANMKQPSKPQKPSTSQENSVGGGNRKAQKSSGFSQLSRQWDKYE